MEVLGIICRFGRKNGRFWLLIWLFGIDVEEEGRFEVDLENLEEAIEVFRRR